MSSIPQQPFFPADFSPRGGGIDYLGMRWVSLAILADDLIPGINNRTRDFGIYCLATWIPWKFHQACTDSSEFTFSNFRRFEEAVGVAISHSLRPESPSKEKLGEPHEKIGVQQKLELPSELSFAAVERTRSTSIFAAPLYGPSLRYLGLMGGYARAEDGTSTEIPLIAENDSAIAIALTVDSAIAESKYFEKLSQMELGEFNEAELDELATCGIHPAFFRKANRSTRLAFLHQLVPNDSTNGRTRTARLLVKTLEAHPGLDLEEIRAVWHTGLFADGKAIELVDEDLRIQRELWSVFQTRQLQRYVVELFMKCFEESLVSVSTMQGIVQNCVDATPFKDKTIAELVREEADAVSSAVRFVDVSEQWHTTVHGSHPSYEWIEEDAEMSDCERALRMLARWWIRIQKWIESRHHEGFLQLGGEDRICISWFDSWIKERLDQTSQDFTKDVLEQLVFGQHIRVALSRFDGKSQKLRFVLGDQGIVPTKSALSKMGKSVPGWTEDRLLAFTDLLCDIGVLKQEDGCYFSGELANKTWNSNET